MVHPRHFIALEAVETVSEWSASLNSSPPVGLHRRGPAWRHFRPYSSACEAAMILGIEQKIMKRFVCPIGN